MIFAPWRRFFFFLLALGLSGSLPAQPAVSAPWPVSAEGLAPDPAWQWGVLDNGLRYVIRHNAQPAGHVSFRFAVQVGFAHETRNEHGYAHFVEHMAFNGTQHFPGESLGAELRKHGVDIGPEVNAFTLLTHTIYDLDAPAAGPADLERWFTVLRDFADGIKFDSKQVKRERGVIASESRDRQSPAAREDLARRRFLYPLSALSNPIEGDVEHTEAKDLRGFYDKWYRPERMLLAVVGDIEPAQIDALVRRHFASLRARTPPPRFYPGFIENPFGFSSKVVHDPKVNGLTVEIISVLPAGGPDTLADRRRWLARSELIYMLNVRLHELLRSHPGRLHQASARSQLNTPFSIETQIGFTAPSTEWKLGMTVLEQELRRSFEYKFRSDEILEARAVMLTSYEQQVKTATTRTSPYLAGNVMQQMLWGQASLSPEDELRFAREWLPQIDALEINQAWRSLWQERRASIFGYGFFPVRDGPGVLDAALTESQRQPVQPPAVKPVAAFAYTDFGPAGKIKRREYLPEIGIHLIEFENGVRANLKATRFETATVHLSARLGSGMLTEPAGQPGLGALASGTLLNGALGRHPPEELRRMLSAAALGLGFATEETCFAFNGQAASAEVEQLLRVMTAFLTDAGWNPEAVALAHAQLGIYYSDLHYTPEGTLGLQAFRTLTGNDPRYTPPSAEQVQARTLAELRQWLDPQLRSGPLELGLVGDLDPEQTIDLLSRTIGALPARSPAAAEIRPVTLRQQGPPLQFDFQGENNRAGIEVVWPLEHNDDILISRQTEVLTAIYAERLRQKLREDLGATYSPDVSHWKSDADPRHGYVLAYITVKPGDVPRLSQLMIGIADTLGRKGATEAEFAQAREPILARCLAEQQENAYWVRHIIARVQSDPEVRQWPLTRVRDFRAMTVADINNLARTVLPAAHAMMFTALPVRK